MADQKLSALPSAGTLTGAELIYVVKGGVSNQSSLSAVSTLLSGTFVPYTGAINPVDLNQQAFVNASTLVVNGSSAPYANTRGQFFDSVNNFSQVNFQNKSAGTNASSDYVLTADNGTNTTNFVDLGINSSVFSDSSFTIGGAIDGYLYAMGGSMLIGTATAKDIVCFTGGTLITNEVMRISGTPGGVTGIFNLKGSVTASSGIGKSAFISTTLNAAANNDVLVGLDIFPTYTPGAFTGVNNIGLRTIGSDILVNSIYVGKSVGNFANNTIISTNSLRSNVSADFCTAIGTIAMRDMSTGNNNVAVGSSALSQSTSGTFITAVGRGAGFTLTGGTNSTFLGSSAGLNASQSVNPTNQTVIGSLAYGDTDNQVFIGNSSVTAIKFGQSKLNFTVPAAATSVVFASGSTFTTVGAFATTITSSAATAVTLPTSGTLYGTATGSITSAQMLASLSDETGTGSLVFATTPTLVTPVLGVATATSINKVTITAPTTSATLTLITGSSLITAGAFALTLTTTAATNATFPTGSGTLAYLAGTNTWTGASSFTNATDTAFTNQNVAIGTAGKSLVVKEGANGRSGTATLSAGTITVANTTITANSRIFMTGVGTTNAGYLTVTIVAATSFTITSSSPTDARLVHYFIVEGN